MLILIYGNGLVGISRKVSEIRSKFDPLNTQEFVGKNLSFPQTITELSSGGLFGGQRLVILEDFDEQIDLNRLPNDSSLTVVLVIKKSLTSASNLIKQASRVQAQTFNFTEAGETNIFPYLDLLAEKNPKALDHFDELLSEWGGQYLLTMIFYLLRRMVQNPKKSPTFVQQRITRQKQNFPLKKITELYRAGLETDFKIKSGVMEEKIAMTLLVNQFLTT